MEMIRCERRATPPLEITARACGLSYLAAQSGNPAVKGTSIAECLNCSIGAVNAREIPASAPRSAIPIEPKKESKPMAKKTSETITCPDCGKVCKAQGFGRHKIGCPGKPGKEAAQRPDKRPYHRRTAEAPAPASEPTTPDRKNLTDLVSVKVEILPSATIGKLMTTFPNLGEAILDHLREIKITEMVNIGFERDLALCIIGFVQENY
jgi:hypothetical protein